MKINDFIMKDAAAQEVSLADTEKLLGNTCGKRPTSCADQLALAVKEAYTKQTAKEA